MDENKIVNADKLQGLIYTIRGVQAMYDSDLAELYGVEIKRLNEQVKRNRERFPEEFMFQLTDEEFAFLRSQNATLETGRGSHRKYLPYVFTEQGVAMLSASKQLSLDVKKYNSQYLPVEIKKFKYAHDRFIIIDDKEVFHFGASLKDLGKKWFAFSRLEKDAFRLMERLEGK